MATHNVTIYHCLGCGSVMHGHSSAEPPLCCGQEMVKAAEQTIHVRECISDEGAGSPSKASPPVIKVPKKPR